MFEFNAGNEPEFVKMIYYQSAYFLMYTIYYTTKTSRDSSIFHMLVKKVSSSSSSWDRLNENKQ